MRRPSPGQASIGASSGRVVMVPLGAGVMNSQSRRSFQRGRPSGSESFPLHRAHQGVFALDDQPQDLHQEGRFGFLTAEVQLDLSAFTFFPVFATRSSGLRWP